MCHYLSMMNAQIDEINGYVQKAINKFDDLKSGVDIETGYIIERAEDKFNEFVRNSLRYDLDLIEQALAKRNKA